MKSALIAGLAAGLSLTAVLPAFADGVSAGDQQLAAYLGVPAGAYSTSELVALDAAKSANDAQTYAYILDGGLSARVSTSNGASVSGGDAQLAASLGLEPGAYSVSDMIAIQDALRDGDTTTANAILAHEVTGNVGAGTVTPGKAQLAAQLGVDPSAYSLSQLVSMASAKDTGSSDL